MAVIFSLMLGGDVIRSIPLGGLLDWVVLLFGHETLELRVNGFQKWYHFGSKHSLRSRDSIALSDVSPEQSC
jgi:hypothetical protein